MKRHAFQKLMEWKDQVRRKPIILRGARQVGKTYLLKAFGQQAFPAMHYFNFEKQPNLNAIFQQDFNTKRILQALEVEIQTPIRPEVDLIVFDEIQDSLYALNSIKYFCEDMPHMYIACAGSLLGIKNTEGSFPVGKATFLNIYPMTFAEFVDAQDDRLMNYVLDCGINSIPMNVHDRLLQHFNYFLAVGGLPEIVATFIQYKDSILNAFDQCRDKQRELIESYINDMTKHAGKLNAMHIRRVWKNIPIQLAKDNKKFVFRGVIPGKRSFADLSGPLDWLQTAGLTVETKICNDAQLPLNAFVLPNRFKLYLFDTGILGALCDFPMAVISGLKGRDLSYKGFFLENAVATELISANSVRHLYSWVHNTSEIDFLLPTKDGIVPIEVKSRINNKAKSLQVYMDRYAPQKAIKLLPENIHSSMQSCIHHMPVYLAAQIWELFR